MNFFIIFGVWTAKDAFLKNKKRQSISTGISVLHDALKGMNILSSFTVTRTTDREAFEFAIRGPYSASSFDFPDRTTPFQATNCRAVLRNMILNYAEYTAPIKMKLSGRPGIRQPMVLSGHSYVKGGRNIYENSSSSALIFPPDEECVVECSKGFSHLLLEFTESSLVSHSASLTGYAPTLNYRHTPLVATDTSRLARLGSIATALAFNLTDRMVLGSPVVFELEQALVNSFIIENEFVKPNTSTNSSSNISIQILRDYIHAHWELPLTVDDIARHCGVSARSVFQQFKKVYDLSPMTYLRNVRLDKSRELLNSDQDDISVMRIALRCGFSNVGYFAKRYQERFGELPSVTAKRAKRVSLACLPLGRRVPEE